MNQYKIDVLKNLHNYSTIENTVNNIMESVDISDPLSRNSILRKYSHMFEFEKITNIFNGRSIEYIKIYLSILDKLTEINYPNFSLDDAFKYIEYNFNILIFNILEKYERCEIIGEYYNFITKKKEYKLSNGLYAAADGSSFNRFDISLDIFPVEFIKLIDNRVYRDKKINLIIDEN